MINHRRWVASPFITLRVQATVDCAKCIACGAMHPALGDPYRIQQVFSTQFSAFAWQFLKQETWAAHTNESASTAEYVRHRSNIWYGIMYNHNTNILCVLCWVIVVTVGVVRYYFPSLAIEIIIFEFPLSVGWCCCCCWLCFIIHHYLPSLGQKSTIINQEFINQQQWLIDIMYHACHH